MPKPFDSKVVHTRDDEVPYLEFEYRQSRMTQGQQAGAVLAITFVITLPLAPIPWILKRRRHKIRLDDGGIHVGIKKFGSWKDRFYAKDHVQRLRTHKLMANGPVWQVVFDFGVKKQVLFDGLSEPELLWMYDEVQSFATRHWATDVTERL